MAVGMQVTESCRNLVVLEDWMSRCGSQHLHLGHLFLTALGCLEIGLGGWNLIG